MKLLEVLDGVSYKVIKGSLDKEIINIQYDSRKVSEADIFVCLSGFEVDGHDFAFKAIESGATVIICEKDIDFDNISDDITILRVEEGRKTLAIMASNFYDHPTKKIKLIGVTGTNGKTTSVYILKSILEKSGEKVGLIGTIANYIGDEKIESSHTTPESLELQKLFKLMVDKGCKYCVMEVSSHALALDRVYGCHFEVGIFTNITRDHLDFHKTFDNYYESKFKLFERSEHAVINVDNNYGYKVLSDLEKLGKDVVTYSINEESDYKATDIALDGQNTMFTVNGTRYEFVLPGDYNVYNALGTIATAKILGLSEENIKAGLLDVVVPGRCERVGVKYNLPYELIIDFAHTPDGLKSLLETLRKLTKNRLIAVYGSGGDRDKVKRAEMGRIGSELADLVIITSDNPRKEDPIAILKEISCDIQKTNYLAIEDRVEAIRLAMDMAEEGDVVVLAGKGHETYQIMPEGKIHFDEREVIANILNK